MLHNFSPFFNLISFLLQNVLSINIGNKISRNDSILHPFSEYNKLQKLKFSILLYLLIIFQRQNTD